MKVILCGLPGEGCLEVNTTERKRYAKALDRFNKGVKMQQDLISHNQAMIRRDTFRRNDYLNRLENGVPEDAPSGKIRS
jgi:hypothetical protein